MDRKKVFLHIGMSKAGSSAIQRTLTTNANTLSESGICYPEEGRKWGNSHFEIYQDLQKGRLKQSLYPALEEAKYQRKIVLSCEGFWLIPDEKIKVLSQSLEGYEASVIFYLRRPWDYAASSYRQSIRRDGEADTPHEYWHRGCPHPHLNYSDQLKRWARSFQLRVRAYEAVQDSIEEDFMSAIGAPLEHVDTQRRITNKTPSDGALQCMLVANRYLPGVLSRLVRWYIRRRDWRLDFMPAVDDEVFLEQAATVVEGWDMDVMREHLPEEDLKILLDQYVR